MLEAGNLVNGVYACLRRESVVMIFFFFWLKGIDKEFSKERIIRSLLHRRQLSWRNGVSEFRRFGGQKLAEVRLG